MSYDVIMAPSFLHDFVKYLLEILLKLMYFCKDYIIAA